MVRTVPDTLGSLGVFGGLGMAVGLVLGFLDKRYLPNGSLGLRFVISGVVLMAAIVAGPQLGVEAVAMMLIGYWPVWLETWTRFGRWK